VKLAYREVMCPQAVLLSLLAFLLCAPLHADGKFFPRHEAVTRDPSMPSQAAVIMHREGMQTLIVESAVESDGTPVAWVLPVPSEPLEIRACGIGTVETALAITAPRSTDPERERSALRTALIGAVVLICLGLLLACMRGRDATAVLLAFVSIVVIVAALLPALGTARGMSPPSSGLEHLRTVQAGLYEVDVVKATNATELIAWLESREFRFNAAARPVVERAIARGWVFCAAQVGLDAGVRAPHPLLVRFASDRIIYPMALTAVGGGQLDLDLVVLAERPVRAEQLDVWSVRMMDARDEPPSYPLWRYPIQPSHFGHPDLVPLAQAFPGDLFVTRLHGRLDLSSVSDDIAIDLLSPDSFAATRRTTVTLARPEDAAMRVTRVASWSLGAAAFVALPLALAARRRALAIVLGVLTASTVGGVTGFALFSGLRVADFSLTAAGWTRFPWEAAEKAVQASTVDEARAIMLRELEFTADASAPGTGEGADRPFAWTIRQGQPGERPEFADAIVIELRDQSGRPWELTARDDGVWRPVDPVD
jgi:hypothetical protein